MIFWIISSGFRRPVKKIREYRSVILINFVAFLLIVRSIEMKESPLLLHRL